MCMYVGILGRNSIKGGGGGGGECETWEKYNFSEKLPEIVKLLKWLRET